MEKTATYTITKDFTEKKLQNVFVKESTEGQFSQKEILDEKLSAAKVLCVCAQTMLSDELVQKLKGALERGTRVYILISSIDEKRLYALKNQCIVHEVPDITGNYIIIDETSLYMCDNNLDGIFMENKACIKKVKDLFVQEFWMNATKEFVSETKEVAEHTFDISPVEGNDMVLIDRSAGEQTTVQDLIKNAETFVVQGTIPPTVKNSSAKIFADKKACEKDGEWIPKTSGRTIIYTEQSTIPLVKKGDWWYATNFSFEKSGNNDGRLFAVKLDDKNPSFGVQHKFYREYSYGASVGKEILKLNGFESVSVTASDSEEKQCRCDYKQFEKIKKADDVGKTRIFESAQILTSDKLASHIDFEVTVTVRQKSKEAKYASIYNEYIDFERRYTDEVKKQNVHIEKINKEISNSKSKIEKLDREILNAQNDIEKQEQSGKEKQKNNELQNKVNNLMKKRSELENNLKKQQDSLSESNSILEKLETYIVPFETREKCEKIAEIIPEAKLPIPKFDMPRFGKLYSVKNGYEYELYPEVNLEEAEQEMVAAKLENVEFVSQS